MLKKTPALRKTLVMCLLRKWFCIVLVIGIINTTLSDSPGRCDDISIIGAGIGGTYAAYKLRHKCLRITVYEVSNRIGGRHYTKRMKKIPDIPVDFGAMRFLPDDHPRMNRSIHELGLKVKIFEQNFGIPAETRHHLRGKNIPGLSLGEEGFLPYNVLPSERLHPDQLWYKIFKDNTNTTDNSEPLFTLASNDGLPLYTQSFEQLMRKYLSNEGYRYIFDWSPFKDYFTDASGVFFRKSKPSPNLPNVKAPEDGFGEISKGFVRRFLRISNRHTVKLNNRLVKIRSMEDGKILLTFVRTITRNGITKNIRRTLRRCSRRVILCVPKGAFKYINWGPLQSKRFKESVLDAAYDLPASKIFLGYSYPWWRGISNFTYATSDLPNQQLYHWAVSNQSGRGILLASYADVNNAMLWKRLQSQGSVVSGSNDVTAVSDQVVGQLHSDLAAIYNISKESIPYPIDGAMFVFDSDPFYAAWQFWRPGYNVEKLRFSIKKPSRTERVYIACSAFTSEPFLAWSEGSLESVDEVLKILFK